jgi:hypothetical protein
VTTSAREKSQYDVACAKASSARCDNDGTGNDGFDDTGNHRPRYPENGTHFTRAQRITLNDVFG